MHQLIGSVYAHIEHWKKALMGPVVTICLLIYQQAKGRSPTWGWFCALIFAGLYWHYKDELSKVLKHPTELPLLTLGYDRYFGAADVYSGFYLQTESELRASNVHISSEETVGYSHKRLFMRWKDPTHEIGKDQVFVDVTCMYWVKDEPHPIGGMARNQIDNFLKAKNKEPRELIVTVNYTDMYGRSCPQRRFLVTQAFENVLKTTPIICCQPLKVQ